MKATGIVRRIDDLGRVVIPKEIRRQMRIREGDPLEIFTENGYVCFRKYSPIGEVDLDTMKLVCDRGLGLLNYTVFDRDGDSIMPKGIKTFDVDGELPENTCIIRSDGDIIGYLQSPSGNREVVASIIGGLLEN
jgi:AbrB family looped-hinge helix DNA binding protein